MRQPLIAGNWKMNNTRAGAESLIQGVIEGSTGMTKTEIAVCVPFVFLELGQRLLSGTPIRLGAQNVSTEASGAYTGEISAAMLREFGCRYVICGHSERRQYYGETDAVVAKKLAMVVSSGMTPILCVGETLEQREQGVTETVIARQIDAIIEANGIDSIGQIEIAYEPVWAIGTGKTATPEQAQEVHAFIRRRIAAHGGAIAEKMRILYGGSVKPSNAADLLAMPDIDGGLIGGASLVAEEFLAICRAGEMAA
ncbi:triose-phosphate isomerase [Thermochromatium tepidum]|uniref:Triosephosphate isomerase n=1 Tax=Thermochromatium tepidum ATCC 43061 TaxID=316276 RepID=A0A6I6E6G7_THETI|nr:triose-phosphate isomerase [Thermochromatium tepidum]QGU32263.1 triose-phosphate isomerase [Thermochromatium tepidum ATCC 43061]